MTVQMGPVASAQPDAKQQDLTGFDLTVVVVKSEASVTAVANSDGGCGATCSGNACISSGA